jgi:nucleoside-diphosphate-sugar epimerase
VSERVLVTGGTGYIAGWCLAELARRGYQVRATVRSADARQRVLDAARSEVADVDAIEVASTDLASDDGWDDAMRGVDHVLHVASPIGARLPGDADAAVDIARNGTLRVLRAATRAGVQRVVMTSAANAASPSSYAEEGVTDEALWTDPNDPTLIPYRRSKTVAELAAWDHVATTADAPELVTVLPGAVLGPIMTTANIGSVGVIARMLAGKMPGVPRIGLEVVDVRDLADAHLRALTVPEAAGERFLATGEFVWMRDIARTLRAELGDAASRVRTRQLPDLAVRLAARFGDEGLRSITPSLGRRNRHTTAKAQSVLGWQPRPAAETVVACAQSLLAHGIGTP